MKVKNPPRTIQFYVNPLIPNSLQVFLISPHSLATWLNAQVMRIKQMITKDTMAWCLIKFSQERWEYTKESKENIHVDIGA